MAKNPNEWKVGELAEISESGAVARIDEIVGTTAKVFLGSKTWLKVDVSFLRETRETSYHLPEWLKVGSYVESIGATITEIKRGPVVFDNGKVLNMAYLFCNMAKEPTQEPVIVEPVPEPVPVVPQPTQAPAVEAPTQAQFNNAMLGLFSGVADMVTQQVMKKVNPIVEDIQNRAPVVHIYKFDIDGVETEFKNEVFHPCFKQVLADIMMGGHVFLWGPAGTGKSHMAEQIAKVMGLKFYAVEKIDDVSELVGYPTPNGELVGTPFTDCVQNGGILLMDEVDSSVPDCLNKMNALLANKRITLPAVGQVQMHKDFHCICAANTCGQGATELYNTRTPIDAAFLNRFMEVIEFDYCEEIDRLKCGNDNEIYDFAIAYRKAVKAAGVESIMSPRNMEYMYKLSHSTQHPLRDDFPKILRNCVLGGMDIDTKNNIVSRLRCPNNRWADALGIA